ncbi:DMT family transporter [Nocardioides caldifontis]|uniref:DMT family transporter n=1 Tax=Nocardioides caldifontis TaxID=2588938 RepID=UPI0011DF85D2|nr:DMT family transporter [Nocardioides caldifontis]
MKERPTTLLATLALLAVTATWGSTFFLIHDLLDRVPVLDFLAVRFAVATVTVVLLFPKALGRLSARARWQAAALGLVYGVAQILQTEGIGHSSASVAGFITGMYVICTPLLAAPLLRQRIGGATWLAVVVAVVGLAVLSLRGFSVGYGEGLVLVSAVLYALHIVGLGAWSRAEDAIGMTIVQLAMVSLVAFVVTAPDGVTLPDRPGDWVSVLYMAVFAAGFAMWAQTWAQAHLPPTRSAIIMTMEPVFAAFFAVLLGGEDLTTRMLVGGGLVLSAMVVVELAPRRKVEAEVPHIAV